MEVIVDDVFRDCILPLLTFAERMALGRSCRRFWLLAVASFRGLPLDFPDDGRVGERRIFRALRGPSFASALRFALAKGAWLRRIDRDRCRLHDRRALDNLIEAGQVCETLQHYTAWQEARWDEQLPSPAYALLGLRLGCLSEPSTFSAFPNLTSLDLGIGQYFQEHELRNFLAQLSVPLGRLTQLRLHFHHGLPTPVAAELQGWLDGLPVLPLLSSLELTTCPHHAAPQIALPWAALPGLRELGVECLASIPAHCPPTLGRLRRLFWRRPAEPGLTTLLAWARLSLEELRITLPSPSGALQPDLSAAVRRLSQLRTLELAVHGRPKRTALRRVLSSLPNLRLFRLTGSPYIPHVDAVRLALAAPRLRTVCMGDCPKFYRRKASASTVLRRALAARPTVTLRVASELIVPLVLDQLGLDPKEAQRCIRFDWVCDASW